MTEEKKRKIIEEDDYIDYPKFKNSIKKLVDKYPDGVLTKSGDTDYELMAKVLHMTVEEVKDAESSAIKKLQDSLGV